MSKYQEAKLILSEICSYHSHNLTYNEAKNALIELKDNLEDDDWTFDLDGNEYRIIEDSAIWSIYVETIKNIVNKCYDLNLDNLPKFIEWNIDWEQTAKNAYYDGYGHTFSSYDGSEINVRKRGVIDTWVFRTN